MSGSTIVVDGLNSEWAFTDRLGYPTNWVSGYDVYGRIEAGTLHIAIVAPVVIGSNTTIWLNTDQNAATGYQVFGNTGGAEFNINFDAAGVPFLYSGGAGEILVGGANVQFARSADGRTVELAVSLASLNDTANPAMDVLIDVNNSVFVPGNYYDKPYTVAPSGSNGAALKVAIVYSETTAYKFFGGNATTQTPSTAYTQLFASAQNQAAMAGVPFDLLTEADLTDISKLSQYDSIIFPSFSHVDSTKVGAITTALTSAVYDYGVGLITAGNFMTNDQTGAAIAGDSYIRLKQLMGLQLVAFDNTLARIDVKATASTNPIVDDLATGELIRTYMNVYGPIGTQTFGALNGVAYEVLATQTLTNLEDGSLSTTNAIYTTVTGGRNVHFATEGMLADNNLLSRALDWVVSNPVAPEVRLEMSRHTAIFASRNDMDQSQEVLTVNPDGNTPGIYDVMLPILEAWKAKYNFVGSYYLNVGDDYGPSGSLAGDPNLVDGMGTDWAYANAYYQRLLALGNELGSHSYSHPSDTNLLTNAQLELEFLKSKQVLEANIPGLSIAGAAIPGMPQSTSVSLKVLDYYTYLTGGNAMVGAGYPGAFGYLTPDTSKGVYIAPNISSDFTQTGWKNLTFAQATAAWLAEWNEAIRLADLPVVVFPWHDYGLTGWNTDYGNPNGKVYGNEAMFTPLIEAAYNYGAEFVTLADLAARLAAFEQATLSTTFNQATNTVTANVTGALGTFQLELDAPIANVSLGGSAWYAYDGDSVFLPAAASSSFSIALGATPADVTRIIELPARGQLLAVTGDGTNLSFTLNGEGRVVVDLKTFSAAETAVKVTGATVVSLNSGLLELLLPTIGLHKVGVELVPSTGVPPAFTEVATSLTQTLITGTAEAGAIVTVREGAGVLGTVAAGANGVWSLAIAPLSNAVHTLSVAATGASGIPHDGGLALLGTTAGDGLAGSLRDDLLIGAAGNDTLDGAAGNDRMIGGLGDDVFVVDATGDVALEVAGQGTDEIRASVSYTIGAEIERLSLTGNQSIHGTGNAHANLITGNVGNNSLSGGLANDTLLGGEGNDTLDGGVGVDSLVGGNGNDWYVLDGTGDIIVDSAGADTVQSAINHTLASALESLVLSGAATSGTGNGGANVIWANGMLSSRLSGLGGTDTLFGGAGADTLLGGAGADSLVGAGGNDSLDGGAEADTIAGGDGRDTLVGGGGSDLLTGGGEADIFRFNNSAHGTDRITDFLSDTDKFAFSALGFGGLLAAGMNVEAAGRFITNTTGTASAQGVGQFVYETDIGRLWWDPDGSGVLGRVAIADLVGAPTLRASDIVIIA